MVRYTGLDGKLRKTFAVFHLVPLFFGRGAHIG